MKLSHDELKGLMKNKLMQAGAEGGSCGYDGRCPHLV